MKKSIKTGSNPKIPFALRLLRFAYNKIGPLFPVYFGNRAYEQWFTTTRFKAPAYESPAMETAELASLRVNNLDITVYIWQDSSVTTDKTLLFIHGWSGRGTQIVNYITALNAMGYRVISFDAPAHGRSPGYQTSALEIVDVVFAIEKQYGSIDAAITHSFGGMILGYAMSLGLKIEAAACLCPPENFEIIIKNFQRLLTIPDKVMQVMIRKSFATHGQVTRNAVDMVRNAKHFSCRGLVIHDEDDKDISWHSGENIADVWPDARFIKTRGLGHRRIIHDKKVIEHILDFLG